MSWRDISPPSSWSAVKRERLRREDDDVIFTDMRAISDRYRPPSNDRSSSSSHRRGRSPKREKKERRYSPERKVSKRSRSRSRHRESPKKLERTVVGNVVVVSRRRDDYEEEEWDDEIPPPPPPPPKPNPKSGPDPAGATRYTELLHQYCTKQIKCSPQFILMPTASGVFHCTVKAKQNSAEGEGESKKMAKQQAAQAYLEKFAPHVLEGSWADKEKNEESIKRELPKREPKREPSPEQPEGQLPLEEYKQLQVDDNSGVLGMEGQVLVRGFRHLTPRQAFKKLTDKLPEPEGKLYDVLRKSPSSNDQEKMQYEVSVKLGPGTPLVVIGESNPDEIEDHALQQVLRRCYPRAVYWYEICQQVVKPFSDMVGYRKPSQEDMVRPAVIYKPKKEPEEIGRFKSHLKIQLETLGEGDVEAPPGLDKNAEAEWPSWQSDWEEGYEDDRKKPNNR